MAVSPLGNVIQINQNMHIAANKVANAISRIDVQDLAAKEISKDEKKEVQEVRPTEETYKVNEEGEREKHQAQDERYRQKRKDKEEDEEEEKSKDSLHHLDLKA
jgi:hypothetical protein